MLLDDKKKKKTHKKANPKERDVLFEYFKSRSIVGNSILIKILLQPVFYPCRH